MRLLENAVFIELMSRGCELYYFSGKNECDFLIKENLQITEAIQVVYGLTAENYPRETDGLYEAMHTFSVPQGTIIVFDELNYDVDLPNGVRIIPAYQWLTRKREEHIN
jgi:predicted AAA+ superfamily ATPase